MGYRCETGVDVIENKDMAIQWYLKSANQGNARAQFNLAGLYSGGQINSRGGRSYYYSKSIIWYEKAAKQGLPDAQYMLGLMHHNGLGNASDP